MSLIDLNILQNEPAEIYHDKAKENLSSHQLMEFMNCPFMYGKEVTKPLADEIYKRYGK